MYKLPVVVLSRIHPAGIARANGGRESTVRSDCHLLCRPDSAGLRACSDRTTRGVGGTVESNTLVMEHVSPLSKVCLLSGVRPALGTWLCSVVAVWHPSFFFFWESHAFGACDHGFLWLPPPQPLFFVCSFCYCLVFWFIYTAVCASSPD